MSDFMFVSPAPHIKAEHTTQSIMLEVIIALLPATIVSVLVFGYRALVLNAVCVVSCVFFEYVFRKLLKRNSTVSDLSAVVTGMILAFNLPAGLPIWMAVLGSAVAIIAVKQLFGGIGHNFANPALVARIVLFISFTRQMATWPTANSYIKGVDAVSGATPLSILKEGTADALPPLINLFTGIRGGCLGETCAIALVVGGIYLIVKKVISPTMPVAILGTVVLYSLAVGANPLYHLFSGGLIFGAFFMATDYSTSPQNDIGKLIAGIFVGIITMTIRLYGGYPEGMSFALLLMNIITPLIDKVTFIMPFGGVKNK